jgi:HAD superfamily hydrolase (TIGR01549 family)
MRAWSIWDDSTLTRRGQADGANLFAFNWLGTMLQAVLFDFGDTLIQYEPMDTRGVFRAAAAAVFERLRRDGHALPPFDVFCDEQFRAIKWAYFWSKLRGREFKSLDLMRRFHQRHRLPSDEPALRELAWLWYSPLIERSGPEDDTADTLRQLREMGLAMGIVSNTFVPGCVLDRHLSHCELLDYFPVRIYSSEVGHRKPSRRIFDIALGQMGVAGADAMFIGDLLKTDIIGARRAGMTTVLLQPWGHAGHHRIAHYAIRRLHELPAIVQPLISHPAAAMR